MKIVVIGGTGLIGSKLVTQAERARSRGGRGVARHGRQHAHRRGPGRGPAGRLGGVDVSNSPSFEDAASWSSSETSTSNLLAAEAAAGVGHHVALSVVGTERLPESGYFRAKIAQEKLIEESLHPVLDRPRDAVLRVPQGHRAGCDGREHGPPAAGADPADGGGGRCEGGRPDRGGRAAQRHRRGRGARSSSVSTSSIRRRCGPATIRVRS